MKQKIVYLSMLMLSSLQTYGYDYLPDDIPLNRVVLINAHNAAQSKEDGWIYYQQDGTLEKQWKAGARGGKFNFHWRKPMDTPTQIRETLEEKVSLFRKTSAFVYSLFGVKNKKNEPFIGLCHESDGKSNCILSATVQKKGEIDNAADFLKKFAQLMKNNPKDVAVIIIENYLHNRSEANGALDYSDQEVDKKLDEVFEKSGLATYCYKLNDDPKHPWPTIGELRKSGKRLVVFNSKRATKYSNNYHSNFNGTYWKRHLTDDIKNGTCIINSHKPDAQGFVVGNTFEQSIPEDSKKGAVLSFMEKLGININIKGHIIGATNYNEINSKETIKKRVALCQDSNSEKTTLAQKGRLVATLLGIDMVEVGEAYQAVKEINMQRIAEFNAEKAA